MPFLMERSGGIEERSMGILIHAETGVLLYIITPHGYLDIE